MNEHGILHKAEGKSKDTRYVNRGSGRAETAGGKHRQDLHHDVSP